MAPSDGNTDEHAAPADSDDTAHSYTSDAFLDALRALDGVANARLLADHVDSSTTTVHNYLNPLVDGGPLNSRIIGETRVWWFKAQEPEPITVDWDEPDNRTFSDQAILDAVRALDGVAGAGEVSARIDCSRRQAARRLDGLAEQDQLYARTMQPSRVWWLPALVPEREQRQLDDF